MGRKNKEVGSEQILDQFIYLLNIVGGLGHKEQCSGLFLDLYSEVIASGAWEPIWGAKNLTGPATCKANT